MGELGALTGTLTASNGGGNSAIICLILCNCNSLCALYDAAEDAEDAECSDNEDCELDKLEPESTDLLDSLRNE